MVTVGYFGGVGGHVRSPGWPFLVQVHPSQVTTEQAERFSVVVPVYNGERVLARAVTSALSQTHRNIEVLVVDDQSDDRSLGIAHALAERDPRVTVLGTGHNSGGPARPRNLGVSASTGTFVAFLDQDDEWYSKKLELQAAKFRQGDYAVVYAGTR